MEECLVNRLSTHMVNYIQEVNNLVFILVCIKFEIQFVSYANYLYGIELLSYGEMFVVDITPVRFHI